MNGIFSIFSILGYPLGFIMWAAYYVIPNYGIAIIIFTIISKALLFPVEIKRFKSTASMSVFNSMTQEINKKYANNPEKRNEEMQKLQEYGYSPTSGCLPLLIQFPILFGLIEVIYNPLTHLMHMWDKTFINETLVPIATKLGFTSTYSQQSSVIQAVHSNPDAFSKVLSTAQIADIQSINLNFLGMNLSQAPTFELNLMLLIPIISGITMIISSIITTKINGSDPAQGKSMLVTTIVMSLFSVYIAFKVPAGVGLYWIFQNVAAIATNLILAKTIDTEKIKQDTLDKINAIKGKKKKSEKKTVTIVNEEGETETKTLNVSEIEKLRLQKAHQIYAEKYGE